MTYFPHVGLDIDLASLTTLQLNELLRQLERDHRLGQPEYNAVMAHLDARYLAARDAFLADEVQG